MPHQLKTIWAQQVDADCPLNEYPRPNLVRDSYICLNGSWDCRMGKKDEKSRYAGPILVPFSPEAPLSGVQKTLGPDEQLLYQKAFTLPNNFCRGRLLLHFEAVDQECQVFLNGRFLGEHKGGYLPFSFDITPFVQAGKKNLLSLTVTDATEYASHARGKQQLCRRGICRSLFYTPQSGIWKTVWLESVPERYVERLQVTPLLDEQSVQVKVLANQGEGLPVTVQVLAEGKTIAQKTGISGQPLTLPLPCPRVWSPEEPFLYDLAVSMEKDEVRSYFGLRKISAGPDKHGILRFFLNNRPYFFHGVLEQGYWPDGLMTAPTDEALVQEIKTLKQMGFNTIRVHVKVETQRFYYHCDRLGMAVWQDMPNGGGRYNMGFVTYLPNVFGKLFSPRDHHYRLFGRTDEQGRKQYRQDLSGLTELLYNLPCVAVWVPFNEGWGQFDAQAATRLLRKIDQTRLVNEACGWFDQGGGDVYSIHNYFKKLRVRPKNRVVALTEYGGYACPVAGHTYADKVFGYQKYQNAASLTNAFAALWENSLLPLLKTGLSAAIYTQASDVENEANGLMTYDRKVEKMDKSRLKKLSGQILGQFSHLTNE